MTPHTTTQVALTDEQIDKLAIDVWGKMQGWPLEQCGKFARAIEAAVLASQKPANDKLLTIIAYAYSIAGAADVSAHILDVLCDPEAATQEMIDAMLPYRHEPAPHQDAQAIRDAALEEVAALFSPPYCEYCGSEAEDAVRSLKSQPTPDKGRQ